jgi:hypothetical protein
MSRLSLEDLEERGSVDPIDVVRSVLAESGSLARFMEVHYLASEPDLFAIMRMIAGLSPADRSVLAEFLVSAAEEGVRLGKVSKNVVELLRDSNKKN